MMIFPGRVIASVLQYMKGGFVIHGAAPAGIGGDDEYTAVGCGRHCPKGDFPEHIFDSPELIKDTLNTGDWSKLFKSLLKEHPKIQPHFLISSLLVPLANRTILLDYVEAAVKEVSEALTQVEWEPDDLEGEHTRLMAVRLSLISDSDQHHLPWELWRLALPTNAPQDPDTDKKYIPGKHDLTARWSAVLGSCHFISDPFDLYKYGNNGNTDEQVPWTKIGKPMQKVAVLEVLSVQHGVLMQAPADREEASEDIPLIETQAKHEKSKQKGDAADNGEGAKECVEFHLDIPTKTVISTKQGLLHAECPAHAIWENFSQEFLAEGASRGGKQNDRVRLRFPPILLSLLQEQSTQEKFRKLAKYCVSLTESPDFLFGRTHTNKKLHTSMKLVYVLEGRAPKDLTALYHFIMKGRDTDLSGGKMPPEAVFLSSRVMLINFDAVASDEEHAIRLLNRFVDRSPFSSSYKDYKPRCEKGFRLDGVRIYTHDRLRTTYGASAAGGRHRR